MRKALRRGVSACPDMVNGGIQALLAIFRSYMATDLRAGMTFPVCPVLRTGAMRLSTFAVLLLSSLAVGACSSTSGTDVLAIPGTSNETTASVKRPAEAVVTDDDAAAAPAAGDGELANALADAEGDTAPVAALEQAMAPKQRRLTTTSVRHTVYGASFRDAKPINFGKVSPRKFAVHGVDVSRWQGDIDWAKLRTQGANFAYIKATDGGDHLDPMFKDNWRGAHAAGLKRGAYHFFYWCRSAADQAEWFIRNVPKVEGALPPVIDVEWNHMSNCKKRPSREVVLEKMRVFMDRLESHYGQRPVIYTAPDFYRDNLKGAFPDHPFWLRSVAAHPSKVYPGRRWVFWQYSGSGLSHGVKGRIDLNVFNGDESAWRRWLGDTTRSEVVAAN